MLGRFSTAIDRVRPVAAVVVGAVVCAWHCPVEPKGGGGEGFTGADWQVIAEKSSTQMPRRRISRRRLICLLAMNRIYTCSLFDAREKQCPFFKTTLISRSYSPEE